MTTTSFTPAQAAQQSNRRTDGTYAQKVHGEAPSPSINIGAELSGYAPNVREVFTRKVAAAREESLELARFLSAKEDERVRLELIDTWLRVEAEYPELVSATSVDIDIDEYADYDHQVSLGGIVMVDGNEVYLQDLEDLRWSNGRNWESFDIVSDDGDDDDEPGRMFLDLNKVRDVVARIS